MRAFLQKIANPNPVTKLLVVLLLGGTMVRLVPNMWALAIVAIISCYFCLHGFVKDGIVLMVISVILYEIPNYDVVFHLPFALKVILSLVITLRVLLLPIVAGSFFDTNL